MAGTRIAQIDRENTTVIGGGGAKEAIEARCLELRKQIQTTTSDYDREKLEERSVRPKMRNQDLRKVGAGLAVAGAGALAAYVWGIRPWHLRWGATDEEVQGHLIGDELAPRPKLRATHAITVNAPAADVWPWLVQMGQTRGGFYSYTWLENMVGCHMRNADEVVPEWQELKVGDKVWLHPKAPPVEVAAIEPDRAIVLKGWGAFVLQPIDETTTRLIIRSQGDYNPDLKSPILNFFLWRVVFEPAHFIMERKMLLGIKARAEKLARAHTEEKLKEIPEYSGW